MYIFIYLFIGTFITKIRVFQPRLGQPSNYWPRRSARQNLQPISLQIPAENPPNFWQIQSKIRENQQIDSSNSFRSGVHNWPASYGSGGASNSNSWSAHYGPGGASNSNDWNSEISNRTSSAGPHEEIYESIYDTRWRLLDQVSLRTCMKNRMCN